MVVTAAGLGTFYWLSILTLILLVSSFILGQTRFSTPLTFLVISTVSACAFLVASPDASMCSINRQKNELPQHEVNVTGRISGFPKFYTNHSNTRGTWEFPLHCEGIKTSTGWKKIRGEIDVRITGASPVQIVKYGQQVIVGGKLNKRIFPGGNPVELKHYSTDAIQVLSDASGISPIAWGRTWRDAASVRLAAGMENKVEQKAVLKALVLGYRESMPSDLIKQFRRTGTVHIFAISGLHVGIVGLLLVIALKTIGIPRDLFGLWLLPLLTIYVISTGMKSSALRALLMVGIFVLAPLFRRKPDIPSSVAIAAILLLLFQPLEIQSAGFIFSFMVVTFIVMVYANVPQKLKQGGWVRSYSTGLIITSVAANMASIPLSALYFGVFSPIALLGNLIVVPLTFCIVLTGWLSILTPFASSIFNHAAVVFINLLLSSVTWLDSLPGSSWQVNPPSLSSIILWYGSLIYLFTHATVQRQRRRAIWAAGCAVLLALLS